MTSFDEDVQQFEQALEEYKLKHGRMFPTCSEILEVALAIGYRKQDPVTDQLEDQEQVDGEPQLGTALVTPQAEADSRAVNL